jgi:2'-5' RNA ligase
MNSKPCNVVLLPSKSLADKAIEISETLRSDEALFTLKDGSFYPHISLYMLELRVDDYEKVREVLRGISATQSLQELTAIRYGQKMGFLDAEYAVTPALRDLQDLIVDALNPIRNGMREKDKVRMEQAVGIKREYFEKYGYPNVKELFRPHVTLTRFNNEKLFDTTKQPDVSVFNGNFERLGFFESGDNGTCVRLLSSYILI